MRKGQGWAGKRVQLLQPLAMWGYKDALHLQREKGEPGTSMVTGTGQKKVDVPNKGGGAGGRITMGGGI